MRTYRILTRPLTLTLSGEGIVWALPRLLMIAFAPLFMAAAPAPATPPIVITPQTMATPQAQSPYTCPAVKSDIDAVQTAVQSAATEAMRVMKLNPQPATDKKLCAAELSVRAAVTKAKALPLATCFATRAAYDKFHANLATIQDGADKVIAAYKCGH